MSSATLRHTMGVVERIETNGVVFVQEVNSRKRGFLANTTPITGGENLRLGMKLELDVEDRGNVMVVAAARPAEG